jgi:hypothetical protein
MGVSRPAEEMNLKPESQKGKRRLIRESLPGFSLV